MRALARGLRRASSARGSSAASTAKRISPPWRGSLFADRRSIACSALGGKRPATRARQREEVAQRAREVHHQRPEAPPPPKPPPPPRKPPPKPPPPKPPPPSRRPAGNPPQQRRPDPPTTSVKTNANDAREHRRRQCAPTEQPGERAGTAAAGGRSRRGSARASRAACRRPTSASDEQRPAALNAARRPRAARRAPAAGSGSPSMTRIMRSTPALMPPKKSPSRKRGTITSSMMRLAVASGARPRGRSRPRCAPRDRPSRRPGSRRRRRSCGRASTASATRIAYCSIVSGSVVGTISTAIWLPLRVSNVGEPRLERGASARRSSVPVRSVTRPVRAAATGDLRRDSGSAGRARAATASARDHVRASWPKSTLGGLRDRLLVLDREVRLGLVAEHHRREVGRERPHRDVVLLAPP